MNNAAHSAVLATKKIYNRYVIKGYIVLGRCSLGRLWNNDAHKVECADKSSCGKSKFATVQNSRPFTVKLLSIDLTCVDLVAGTGNKDRTCSH